VSNQLMQRRIQKLERKVEPQATNATRILGESPEFRKFVEAQGLDFEAMRRSGDILGAMPRDLLVRCVERLKVINSRTSERPEMASDQ
jgi:hypothetical protein